MCHHQVETTHEIWDWVGRWMRNKVSEWVSCVHFKLSPHLSQTGQQLVVWVIVASGSSGSGWTCILCRKPPVWTGQRGNHKLPCWCNNVKIFQLPNTMMQSTNTKRSSYWGTQENHNVLIKAKNYEFWITSELGGRGGGRKRGSRERGEGLWLILVQIFGKKKCQSANTNSSPWL